ncbi:hypothetical protein LEP1GSC062_3106 [Leptospira alexanderi serovar Manhao 3 str. L 60]|uniref:Uncharacterized protein n=1 Tax=Leptospira alexanderi serovar Manhao 3 str. L 60 TaxID=1049759 RepID=V6HWJ1_9LEPT|nr:hypothetical protein LEP1GSC062_3106 [Leptospira alexanderi serovar Manhao 3 str. L 60]
MYTNFPLKLFQIPIVNAATKRNPPFRLSEEVAQVSSESDRFEFTKEGNMVVSV